MSATIELLKQDETATAPKRPSLVARVRDMRMPPRARGFVTWLSVGLLLIAFALLVWGMVSAVSYTLQHPGPPCTNPPQLQAYPPQWVVVGLCLVTFVLGHLTARWQLVDPKHTARHNVKEVEHPDADPRRKEALIIQALLLVFLLEIVGLLIIEAWTLSQGVWPITYYVRCAYNAAGVQSMLAAASITFLVGRWFWLPARGKDARTGS